MICTVVYNPLKVAIFVLCLKSFNLSRRVFGHFSLSTPPNSPLALLRARERERRRKMRGDLKTHHYCCNLCQQSMF